MGRTAAGPHSIACAHLHLAPRKGSVGSSSQLPGPRQPLYHPASPGLHLRAASVLAAGDTDDRGPVPGKIPVLSYTRPLTMLPRGDGDSAACHPHVRTPRGKLPCSRNSRFHHPYWWQCSWLKRAPLRSLKLALSRPRRALSRPRACSWAATS